MVGRAPGARTHEGLARIRAATTKHGRYSRESQLLLRRVREYQRNGWKSADALPAEFRDRIRFISRQPLSDEILETLLAAATWPWKSNRGWREA
jgi:hypothetical protein